MLTVKRHLLICAVFLNLLGRAMAQTGIIPRPIDMRFVVVSKAVDRLLCEFKLCVYHPGVFSKLNKIGLISQTNLLLFYLMYYSGDMFRLSI